MTTREPGPGHRGTPGHVDNAKAELLSHCTSSFPPAPLPGSLACHVWGSQPAFLGSPLQTLGNRAMEQGDQHCDQLQQHFLTCDLGKALLPGLPFPN